MYETITVEERNKPAVALVFKYFANDVESAASSRGMPGVRVVFESIVSECTVTEEIEAGVNAVMDEVVDALTRPLTDEEKSPKTKEVEKPSRINFKGDIEEVSRFFYQRGWTDGLAIIPPTEEAVAEMLAGTDLPPKHLVATMGPREGKATVEKIAINAVLAGALPTYMPLLIAGVEAMTDPRTGPTGLAVSTGSFAPLWIVNGPIRKDLHINDSYGALSPGDIANATIGRTLGLITKNIRGVRKGIEDMGVFGNPCRYSMVIAENEEESPWEPLHVEHGLKKEDSTITVSFCQSFGQLMLYGTDDKSILNSVVYNVTPGSAGVLLVVLTPPSAKVLANKGWTKQSVREYIVENARAPRDHFARYRADSGEKEDPRELVPIFSSRQNQLDTVRIYVFGGWGSWVSLLSGGPRPSVTKKAELPENWNKLITKYKNIVPTYARY